MPSADGGHVSFGMFPNRESDWDQHTNTHLLSSLLLRWMAAVRIVSLSSVYRVSFLLLACPVLESRTILSMRAQKRTSEMFKEHRKLYTFRIDWIHWSIVFICVSFLHIVKVVMQFRGEIRSVNKHRGDFCRSPHLPTSLCVTIHDCWFAFIVQNNVKK